MKCYKVLFAFWLGIESVILNLKPIVMLVVGVVGHALPFLDRLRNAIHITSELVGNAVIEQPYIGVTLRLHLTGITSTV